MGSNRKALSAPSSTSESRFPTLRRPRLFFEAAFGAEVLYDMKPNPGAQEVNSDLDSQSTLGIRPGAKWLSSRMLRLGEGPSIELFEYSDEVQRDPAIASDFGIQHFAVYVDDIDAARQRSSMLEGDRWPAHPCCRVSSPVTATSGSTPLHRGGA